MSARKTESRIPANFQTADLGEAVIAPDGRCTLVSFITSPLALNRENTYIVFVTDPALSPEAESFECTFTQNDGTPDVQTTDKGEIFFTPTTMGTLNIALRILDSGNAEQAKLEMVQAVTPLNAELESLIAEAEKAPGPGIGNPDVARELVNDHNPYYQGVALKTPESGDWFQQFVFGIVSEGTLRREVSRRKRHLAELAAALNDASPSFATLSVEGAGVCGIRLALLAMTLPQGSGPGTLLNWTELPEPPSERATADEELRQTLAALDENDRIDLFNLARFPKSNITQCGHILETLRDRYFPNTNFDDILTGMAGTRAQWMMRHYKEGPLLRS